MKKIITCLALAAALLLAGCFASSVTQENMKKLSTGMSTAEVEAIMGAPTEKNIEGIGPLNKTIYSYTDGDNSVTVVFVNDKLLTRVGSFSN